MKNMEELKKELEKAIQEMNTAYDYYFNCGGMYNTSYYEYTKRNVARIEREIEELNK